MCGETPPKSTTFLPKSEIHLFSKTWLNWNKRSPWSHMSKMSSMCKLCVQTNIFAHIIHVYVLFVVLLFVYTPSSAKSHRNNTDSCCFTTTITKQKGSNRHKGYAETMPKKERLAKWNTFSSRNRTPWGQKQNAKPILIPRTGTE